MNSQIQDPLRPPTKQQTMDHPGDWLDVPTTDPVVAYIVAHLGHEATPADSWQVARLSSAVYIYRELPTEWKLIAKFHAAKTGADANRHAAREHDYTLRAREHTLSSGDIRVVEPLGLWRGILFLEYIDGLTLEDLIAIRRNRPGTLLPALDSTARFLADLHVQGGQPEPPTDTSYPFEYIRKVIDNLAKHGVLQGEALVVDGLNRLVTRWAQEPGMRAYTPALTHGDATTTNFVFPWEGDLVVIDWERAKITDPAADTGRILAEVSHTITRHGGNAEEAHSLTNYLLTAYCQALPKCDDVSLLSERIRFHQATSTLRIARNGWLSRLERTALVAQAMALLT